MLMARPAAQAVRLPNQGAMVKSRELFGHSQEWSGQQNELDGVRGGRRHIGGDLSAQEQKAHTEQAPLPWLARQQWLRRWIWASRAGVSVSCSIPRGWPEFAIP